MVGVTVVENAFRVHLLVSRRASEAALPARSTRGFLFCDDRLILLLRLPMIDGGSEEGSTNMSHTPSPPFEPNAGIDHWHLALRLPIDGGAWPFRDCCGFGIDHSRTVP